MLINKAGKQRPSFKITSSIITAIEVLSIHLYWYKRHCPLPVKVLICNDIFQFNHPCSTTDTVAYKLSAKYNTHHLLFKTLSTGITFSTAFPHMEAPTDRWRIYEIKGEELYQKTLTKTLQMLSKAHKIIQSMLTDVIMISFRWRLALYERSSRWC